MISGDRNNSLYFFTYCLKLTSLSTTEVKRKRLSNTKHWALKGEEGSDITSCFLFHASMFVFVSRDKETGAEKAGNKQAKKVWVSWTRDIKKGMGCFFLVCFFKNRRITWGRVGNLTEKGIRGLEVVRRKEEAVDFNQMQKSVDVSQQACTNASAMSWAACSTLKPPPFPSLPLSVFFNLPLSP